jgi:predicted Zn-dependent protease with MMP-like domain
MDEVAELMSEEEFEEVVKDVISTLPDEFKEYLQNILILVADAPNDEQRRVLKLRRYMRFYGLYQGVPLNFPGRDRIARTPDTITIFRKAILESYSDIESIRRQIRSTVLHEIGHYFGMSEEQLRNLHRRYR